MNKPTKFLAAFTGSVVVLAGYMAAGVPLLPEPIIVTVPLEGRDGMYHRSLPDVIWIDPDANDRAVTIAHENAHRDHPSWSECEVSEHLLSRGMVDNYQILGRC